MKSNKISDPIVVEIFRVEKGKASIDTEKRQWVGVDLLQEAMLTYEPDLYHPEILIKTAVDSPLIRNKIEELDVEEWQNTTGLFAEIFNLDFKTKNKLKGEPPLRRVISLDQETGKLVGVAMIGHDMPDTIAIELLDKAFKEKPFQNPIVLHQAPINYRKPKVQLSMPDSSTRELMGAIENYILETVKSNTATSNKEVDTINLAFDNLKQQVFNQSQTNTNKAPAIPAVSTRAISPVSKSTLSKQPDNQTVTLQPNIQPLTRNNVNEQEPDTQLVEENTNVNQQEPETQLTAENTSEEWLKPSSPMNWKQRKNRDRNIIDLAERIVRLSKQKDYPPKKMIVSFLASLGTAQYEFLDKLITCFTTNNNEAVEESSESTSVADESTVSEQKNSEAITQQTEESVDESVKDEPVLIESAIADESVLIDPEIDEFKEISEDEKELHYKILDHQKQHNVSYDHAASMVLK